MSGAVKAVKKVFKKVAKNPLSLAGAALATGALVFTAGSAMGALPSWGDAVSSVIGGDTTLSRVLSGAVTQAGYGALIGGAGAAITGGDIGTGLEIGGATGALTGGFSGGLSPDPASQTSSILPSQASAPTTGSPAASPQFIGPLNSSAMVQTGAAPALNGVSAVAAPALTSTSKGLLTGYSGDRDMLLGNIVGGVANGLVTGMSADDQAKALRERDDAEREWISGNYGSGSRGLLRKSDVASLPNGDQNPRPTDRFNPKNQDGQWVYDPSKAKIIYVQNQAVA